MHKGRIEVLDSGLGGARFQITMPLHREKVLRLRVHNLILARQAREQVDGLREAAESANRAKDEFLAMLGHELRNPLSPIRTALQLMKLQGPEGSERSRNDRSQGGLGLGLTIVRNLVEQHGGSVLASSEGPGRGSEFVVRLPRATP